MPSARGVSGRSGFSPPSEFPRPDAQQATRRCRERSIAFGICRFELAKDAIDQLDLPRQPVFADHAIEGLADHVSEMIGQDGVAVPGIELLVVDLEGRSLQRGQPAFEEPIHDLLVRAWRQRRRSGVFGGGRHFGRPRGR